MADYRRRKRLRDRVAARKAGRSEYEHDGAPPNPWRARLRWIAIGCQALALILVLVEIGILLEQNFLGVDYVRLTVYVGLFFMGRLIQVGLTLTRH